MEIGINELFEMLSSNNDEKIQKIGIEEGKKIKNLHFLMQPIGEKSSWENCARIIEQKSDEILSEYDLFLFAWLQDENWPGFEIIYNRIKTIPAELMHSSYIYSIKKAIKEKHESKCDTWLITLLELADNKKLYNILEKKEKKIIKKYMRKYKKALEERKVWQKEWYENVEKNHFPLKLEVIDDDKNLKTEDIFSKEYKNTLNKVKHLLPKGNEEETYGEIFKTYLHNTKMLLPNEIQDKISDIRLLTLGKVFRKEYSIIEKVINLF